MKKIDLSHVPVQSKCNYPPPFDAPCRGSRTQKIGAAAGLSAFGVRLTRFPPGVWSSQRHWHSHEDEFVMVVEGEIMLVTDAGEEKLAPGDCAAFRAGDADGHHLINRSARDAVVLEVGNSDPRDTCTYSDIDMVAAPGVEPYLHRDGTPYPVNPG